MARRLRIPEPTGLDRLIESVAPSWGLARREARIRLAATDAFNGASRRRGPMVNFTPPSGSADEVTLDALPLLRDRSRHLERNNAVANGAIETKVTKVVGRGLTPKARIDHKRLGLTPPEARTIERDLEWCFRTWAASHEPDITGHDTLVGLLELVWRESLNGGDVLVLRRYDDSPGRLLGTCYQLIEADRLGTPPGKVDGPNLAGGVELDDRGRATGYWIADRNPAHTVGEATTWSALSTSCTS